MATPQLPHNSEAVLLAQAACWHFGHKCLKRVGSALGGGSQTVGFSLRVAGRASTGGGESSSTTPASLSAD